jgi:hypothetical protein
MHVEIRQRKIYDEAMRVFRNPAMKCRSLPFIVWCVSGSRAPVLFFVELGAAMIVASTTIAAPRSLRSRR